MPFVTAGDPDLPTTAMLISELVAAGARSGRNRHSRIQTRSRMDR